ncbi:ABC transporter permease [Planobispora siamensis]|uniref:ABC-2 type transporter transmembrane domain-containing protein n=1 Tax=Planobispora siamensis TaxID=936338 RepID=A0A8J3SHN9_9ACTN|nr:ABC transporter permease [Planobispora siamensis]GIH92319.1 hypothetical protein Psi01_29490 [Planobispora siamensis]
MRALILILLKDLRQRLRDGTLVIYAVALPLGLAFLLNLVMGGSAQRLDARYGVVGLPAFTEQVLRPMEAAGHIRLSRVASAEQGRELAGRGRLDAVFVGGPEPSAAASESSEASRDPSAGSPEPASAGAGSIEVIGSVDAPVAVQVARELAESYAAAERGERLALSVADAGPEAVPDLRALPEPIQLRQDTSLSVRQLDTRTYHVAGMGVFFLFFTVMLCVAGIFAERDSGTLARIMAAPVPGSLIMAAKLVGGVLTGLIGMAVLIVVSGPLLGARWGDPAGVAALVTAVVLAATGLMAVVATFTRTAEQAANWQSVVATVCGIVGGAFFSVGQLGGLAAFGAVTPHHWFMEGLADLRGGGSVALPVTVLLGFAVVGIPVALARLGRMARA